jgi:uncharacterized membrane protein YeiH
LSLPGAAVSMSHLASCLSLDVFGAAKLGYDFGAIEGGGVRDLLICIADPLSKHVRMHAHSRNVCTCTWTCVRNAQRSHSRTRTGAEFPSLSPTPCRTSQSSHCCSPVVRS